ncbi:MAG: 4-hydroxy-tetrahydrodipicolinate reductase [bacterium]|nr:4-hydroxy-tetrahydrodipicolinate reductase [bacterium]
MIKVALFGAGRMGDAIAQKISATSDITLHELFERNDSGSVGKLRNGSMVLPERSAENSNADIFVDFTEPISAMQHFRLAAQLHLPIVVGTTGLSKNQLEEVRESSVHIPCLFAPNLSLGVNLLYDIVAQAASSLPPEYDIEIVEQHHRLKIDKPSGTALQLARVIGSARGTPPEIHALRGGEVVGTHTIIFSGPGERLEFTHEAFSRSAFATGVLQAVRFLVNREPGLYFVGDALGLR